jgi:hypothetical protein
MKNSKSNYDDGENAEIEIDDRNFIDMVTSKIICLFFSTLDPYFNSKEYYQKFSEIENTKFNPEPYGYGINPYIYPIDTSQKDKKGRKK